METREGVCDRLLYFPSDVPPVLLGFLIPSVFGKPCSVCLSCHCMCLVWCRAWTDIKRAKMNGAVRSYEAGSLSAWVSWWQGGGSKVLWWSCTHAADDSPARSLRWRTTQEEDAPSVYSSHVNLHYEQLVETSQKKKNWSQMKEVCSGFILHPMLEKTFRICVVF